eukprot:TRINITY_DN17213_c0_g2_i1.p1 TRINITY_DN17213_c0_g2~~TRINITY_DN17213_c0_g2_i1.p1  ORF type:complete len:248 (-),score=53.30 TRINITY_DN17213_c0_g2_i1:228-911(-)
MDRSEPTPMDPETLRGYLRLRLLRRFEGSMLGAWRVIDPRQHGRLSFHDFCRAVRHMGFIIDVRTTFEMLDRDEDGFIVLEDIDPALARLLKGFLSCLVDSHRSAKNAWAMEFASAIGKQIDVGRCPRGLFAKGAQRCGFRGDVDALYKAMDVDRASNGISYKDFAYLDKLFSTNPRGIWNHNDLRPACSMVDLRSYRTIDVGSTLWALQKQSSRSFGARLSLAATR